MSEISIVSDRTFSPPLSNTLNLNYNNHDSPSFSSSELEAAVKKAKRFRITDRTIATRTIDAVIDMINQNTTDFIMLEVKCNTLSCLHSSFLHNDEIIQ